jgi:phage major head subunit gpT-like protein
MPVLTSDFVVNLETRMHQITERDYTRLLNNLWWQRVATTKQSDGLKDLFLWLLSTAQIRDEGKGGNIAFDDIVMQYTQTENKWAGGGLKIRRDKLEDNDQGGLHIAAQWSADMGAYMAYWPQKRVVDVLKNGHSASLYPAYDGLAYFATNHPLNPYRTSAGTYSNLFTGGSAYPIDDSVTVDVALTNMSKLFAAIASVKMPNGEDPRYLRPSAILCSPRLFPRAVQLTNAKFIAQAATGGVATADAEALIRALGFAQPIMADELAGFESDTTYFVVCEQLQQSELGGIVYVDREPFHINYYGVLDQAQLNRADELEWHCKGRNVAAPGHPFLIFKCKGS